MLNMLFEKAAEAMQDANNAFADFKNRYYEFINDQDDEVGDFNTENFLDHELSSQDKSPRFRLSKSYKASKELERWPPTIHGIRGSVIKYIMKHGSITTAVLDEHLRNLNAQHSTAVESAIELLREMHAEGKLVPAGNKFKRRQ